MTRGFSLIKVGYGLLLGVTGILHIFRLVLEMKAGKEIPASSRFQFSITFWYYNGKTNENLAKISRTKFMGG